MIQLNPNCDTFRYIYITRLLWPPPIEWFNMSEPLKERPFSDIRILVREAPPKWRSKLILVLLRNHGSDASGSRFLQVSAYTCGHIAPIRLACCLPVPPLRSYLSLMFLRCLWCRSQQESRETWMSSLFKMSEPLKPHGCACALIATPRTIRPRWPNSIQVVHFAQSVHEYRPANSGLDGRNKKRPLHCLRDTKQAYSEVQDMPCHWFDSDDETRDNETQPGQPACLAAARRVALAFEDGQWQG